jgi:membrane dipeptidase
VNFSLNDVRADAQLNEEPLYMLTRHFQYLADRIGIDHVAIGSDLDGATIAAAIKALRACGFGNDCVRKIAFGNWMRVFRRTWRPALAMWTPHLPGRRAEGGQRDW